MDETQVGREGGREGRKEGREEACVACSHSPLILTHYPPLPPPIPQSLPASLLLVLGPEGMHRPVTALCSGRGRKGGRKGCACGVRESGGRERRGGGRSWGKLSRGGRNGMSGRRWGKEGRRGGGGGNRRGQTFAEEQAAEAKAEDEQEKGLLEGTEEDEVNRMYVGEGGREEEREEGREEERGKDSRA